MFFNWFRHKRSARRVYLDHAAASPLHPEVREAMLPYLGAEFGNPSAIHAEGRVARAAIEDARTQVARVLGVRPPGITFTSGGTEANNLAILGYLRALHESGRAYADMEVVTTAIEHPSIGEALAAVRALGVTVTTVPVDGEGFVIPAALHAVLTTRTVMTAVAYANSEVGVVQRVHALARELRRYEREQGIARIMLCVDAAQAPLWLPCDLPRLDADLLTIDAGKCGGPKGSGAVALRHGVLLSPVMFGGGQEAGLRPGTENVAGIVGLAAALVRAQKEWQARAQAVAVVRDEALALLPALVSQAVVNGPLGEERLANNINISLPGFDTEYAAVVLDAAGFAVSTKSACAGAGSGQSAVVFAMTGDAARASATLRLTLGEETTLKNITDALTVIAAHCARMAPLTK